MRIIALILLVLTSPIFIGIAILLALQGGFSVLFIQKRIGFHKKEFKIYKFKTMEAGEITFIGKVLRKTGLDELPQLLNIIKGEMAFVGPRPLTQFDIERLKWNKSEFENRWNVKPGITGIAQLSKVCSADLSMKNDLYYVENKSRGLDFKIFLKSIFVPIIGKLSK